MHLMLPSLLKSKKAGFSILKLVEDMSPTCSDPIRIYLENVPSDWNPDSIDDLTSSPWCKDDGIEDSFHSFMDEHFDGWEIVQVDGIEDGMPDYSWMLHGWLKH